jgi:hypothetical protein
MRLPPFAAHRFSTLLGICGLITLAGGQACPAAEIHFSDDGVAIEVKGMSGFTLTYPKLEPGGRNPVEKKVTGKHVDLKYAGDTGLAMDLAAGGTVEMRFANVPKDLKSFTLSTMIGAEFADGGSWKIGKGEPQAFPQQKPAKPFLFQGNAGTFVLTDAANHGLSITVPEYTFQQLQDNREWGWKIFQVQFFVPYNPGWAVHTVVIGDGGVAGAAPAPVKVQVDRFGQTTRKEFPGKVKDEAELKADAQAEGAYYAGLKPMPTDSWGGLPDSGARLGLQKTGFFHTERKGKRWVMVDPDGNACFHLGVCSFGFSPGEDATYVKDREDIYEWLPPTTGEFEAAWHPDKWWHDQAFSFYVANLIRKYGKDFAKDRQLHAMVDRVRSMGFNAVGAFSGNSPAFTETHFPRVAMVGMGPALPGINGVPDPFDAGTLKSFDEACAKGVAANAEDPLIVGYFFANEQAFEDIPRGVPQLPAKHAAKRRLVELLQKKYPTVAELNAAWGLHLADFAAAAETGLAVTSPKAFADMREYTELFLDTYYQAITSTFRKYDQKHLMIGNRWQPGTANSEVLCRTAGKYMDVISVNYYTLGVDPVFMKRIYDWSGGKPQMWSEFYYTSGDESNVAGGGLDMKSQKERGLAYRQYVENGASLDFVVGIEWFTLIDQAVTGRWFSKLNGERNNTGLFNVADRPYKDMIAEMASSHREVYGVWLDGKAPYQIADPRFSDGAGKGSKTVSAGHATGPIAITGSTDNWPGRPPERIGSDRIVSGKDGKGLEAAFKVCWDEKNLYLLANVTDPSPLNNTAEGDALWQGDGLELFIGSESIDQAGAMLFSDHQLLLAARRQGKGDPWFLVNAPTQPKLTLVAVPAVDGSGYTLEAAIPWSAIGVTPKDGTTLLFDLAVDDAPEGGSRTRQLMWNGGARNSADRSHWGRLQLVP